MLLYNTHPTKIGTKFDQVKLRLAKLLLIIQNCSRNGSNRVHLSNRIKCKNDTNCEIAFGLFARLFARLFAMYFCKNGFQNVDWNGLKVNVFIFAQVFLLSPEYIFIHFFFFVALDNLSA